jgi:hypothetical protein
VRADLFAIAEGVSIPDVGQMRTGRTLQTIQYADGNPFFASILAEFKLTTCADDGNHYNHPLFAGEQHVSNCNVHLVTGPAVGIRFSENSCGLQKAS